VVIKLLYTGARGVVSFTGMVSGRSKTLGLHRDDSRMDGRCSRNVEIENADPHSGGGPIFLTTRNVTKRNKSIAKETHNVVLLPDS
jgi:hypothetical protein